MTNNCPSSIGYLIIIKMFITYMIKRVLYTVITSCFLIASNRYYRPVFLFVFLHNYNRCYSSWFFSKITRWVLGTSYLSYHAYVLSYTHTYIYISTVYRTSLTAYTTAIAHQARILVCDTRTYVTYINMSLIVRNGHSLFSDTTHVIRMYV